jgi:hypothetical protein
VGQPRVAEGLRLVNELQRRAVFLQSDMFLGLSLRYASYGMGHPKEGLVLVQPMDRATIGLAMGLQTRNALAFRVLAGPELRFVEDWLFFRGVAEESAAGMAFGGRVGAGVDWDIGRFAVSPVAYTRVSSAEPFVSAGASLDVRFQWRR